MLLLIHLFGACTPEFLFMCSLGKIDVVLSVKCYFACSPELLFMILQQLAAVTHNTCLDSWSSKGSYIFGSEKWPAVFNERCFDPCDGECIRLERLQGTDIISPSIESTDSTLAVLVELLVMLSDTPAILLVVVMLLVVVAMGALPKANDVSFSPIDIDSIGIMDIDSNTLLSLGRLLGCCLRL